MVWTTSGTIFRDSSIVLSCKKPKLNSFPPISPTRKSELFNFSGQSNKARRKLMKRIEWLFNKQISHCNEKVLLGEQVVWKWEDIQSSWTLNELFVAPILSMLFSARNSADIAVDPATAKFTPCLNSAFSSLYGFRRGRSHSIAVYFYERSNIKHADWSKYWIKFNISLMNFSSMVAAY